MDGKIVNNWSLLGGRQGCEAHKRKRNRKKAFALRLCQTMGNGGQRLAMTDSQVAGRIVKSFVWRSRAPFRNRQAASSTLALGSRICWVQPDLRGREFRPFSNCATEMITLTIFATF